ncbi:DUF1642 domain-containing protein [Streptococcus thermophilus]|uniref:DUF1642 domain-containing protein n=1 Tax=Streptococcus thermophilus TaxID=1308 RepID=UPI001C64B393|nr:DUF1642 domain-containing protein [Streptococcus thermophilus]MBW7802616.1 DUF1642 domain-containing protein [Streptococcus thermophilus]
MKQNDFYEVDGCTDFIPVKLIKEHKHIMNALELEVTESGFRTFAPNTYKFPKVDEPQKVTVPKFVAEWIEYCKSNKLTLLGAFDPVSEHGIGLADTFTGVLRKGIDWAKRNQKTFARAWLDGYEVEKEKLYTVEIPDPNSYIAYKYLSRNDNGIYIDESNNINWKQRRKNQLTESEIKQDFDFLWRFAEEVE